MLRLRKLCASLTSFFAYCNAFSFSSVLLPLRLFLFSLPAGLFGTAIPSKENMKDDVTGEDLMQRPDDTAEALVKRLDSYEEMTFPILEHYAPFGIVKKVDGNVAFDKVWDEVKKSLVV